MKTDPRTVLLLLAALALRAGAGEVRTPGAKAVLPQAPVSAVLRDLPALQALPLLQALTALPRPQPAVRPVSPFTRPRVAEAVAPLVQAAEELERTAAPGRLGEAMQLSARRFDGVAARRGSADGGGGGAPPAPPKGGKKDADPPTVLPVFQYHEPLFPRTKHSSQADKPHIVEALRAARRGLHGGYVLMASRAEGPEATTEKGHFPVASLIQVLSVSRGKDPEFTFRVVREAVIEGYQKGPGELWLAKVSYPEPAPREPEAEASVAAEIKAMIEKAIPAMDDDDDIPPEIAQELVKEKDPEVLANFLAGNLPLQNSERQVLLAAPTLKSRLVAIATRMRGLELDSEVFAKLNAEGEAAHRKESIRVRIAELQKELGEDGGELAALKAKVEAAGLSPQALEAAQRELGRLAAVSKESPEYSGAVDYLNWLTGLPWTQRSEDRFDPAAAAEILDRDHHGMRRVKDRVLELLAVKKRTGTLKGTILCFVGPPGTGKTSIASAIAEALGRKFVRLALGGVHDESVIRGHGRTYVRSRPGRVIQKMRQAGTKNPVFLLDEIDKLGKDGAQGDPSAALLEVLDPEQNHAFEDQHMAVPYDLSEVLFITTANSLDSIPEPLRDRMEIIEFDGYTPLEKLIIAQRFAVPKALAAAGLSPEQAGLSVPALRKVIAEYTYEAGVRKLFEKAAALLRKVAAAMELKGEAAPGELDAAAVERHLGRPIYTREDTTDNGLGRSTGLAVMGSGGSTLNVEVVSVPGTGKIHVRQQMGKMAQDSAENAFAFVQSQAKELGLDPEMFRKIDLHVAFSPAGELDGPSAGTAMTIAIVSRLTGRPVRKGIAMTGEITLGGRVLPIGGLREKTLGALRAGYKTVLHPPANQAEADEIPAEVRAEIELIPVRTAAEVFERALEPAPPAQ